MGHKELQNYMRTYHNLKGEGGGTQTSGTFRILLVVLTAILGSGCLLSQIVLAQPNVKIVFVEPDVRNKELPVGAVQEIKCIAHASPPGLRIVWSCTGPGNFDGNTRGLASIYLVPGSLSGKSEKVTITVTVTNNKGETAHDSLTFTLLAPIAQATPTPTPMSKPTIIPPTITVAPIPSPPFSLIEKRLKQADAYFDQNRYTQPEKENAFEVYKDVLRENPANAHAREKIRQIAELYKNWGDTAYQQANYPRAEMYYQRYLPIAQYLLQTLGDETVRQAAQEIEQRLKTHMLTPTPGSIQGSTVTPPPMSTVLPETKRLDDHQKTLDQYFNTYKQLKAEELQGVNRHRQLIAAIRNIIRTLTAIKDMLEEDYTAAPDAELFQKIQRTQKARQVYEQELLDRLLTEGP